MEPNWLFALCLMTLLVWFLDLTFHIPKRP
jgi:hypothetical protein